MRSSCSRNLLAMVTKRKESSPPPVNMMPYLPDELLLNCLARISRLYYPTLSLVSKRFHSLLASTELYRIRTLLGCTENCIYACLMSPQPHWYIKPHWCTLSQKPTRATPFWNPFRNVRNHTRMSSSGNLLVSVPSHNLFPNKYRLISTIVGSDIYIMIRGYPNAEPSSRVFVMNCRFHTWYEAPSMLVAKKDPIASVLDGKIYVVERSTDRDFSNFIESFDPKTKMWEHVPSPSAAIYETYIYQCFAFKGNLYLLFNDKVVIYNPKENKWDVVVTVGFERLLPGSCAIDNVLYRYNGGSFRMIEWYDCVARSWRSLKGVKKLPKLPKLTYGSLRLENCGGKIVLLWEENVRSICCSTKEEKRIWCAEIALEKRNIQEICGKVKWCDVVLTVPKSCRLEQLFVATI